MTGDTQAGAAAGLTAAQAKRAKVLAGPSTHICWTPDAIPKDERIRVVLISESTFLRLKAIEGAARVAIGAWDASRGVSTQMDGLRAALAARGAAATEAKR